MERQKVLNRNRFVDEAHKPCPVCGLDMVVSQYKKFGQNNNIYWLCTDKLCNHKEVDTLAIHHYIKPKPYTTFDQSLAKYDTTHQAFLVNRFTDYEKEYN